MHAGRRRVRVRMRRGSLELGYRGGADDRHDRRCEPCRLDGARPMTCRLGSWRTTRPRALSPLHGRSASFATATEARLSRSAGSHADCSRLETVVHNSRNMLSACDLAAMPLPPRLRHRPGPVPNNAPPRPGCGPRWLHRSKPHDTPVQAGSWPHTRPLDGPNSGLAAQNLAHRRQVQRT